MIKVALDTTPLNSTHKDRGIGYYTSHLWEQLTKRDDIRVLDFQDIAKVKEVDLVHFPYFDFFFRTLPIRKSYPIVVTVHDTIPLIFPKNYPVGFLGKINFFMQKLALSKVRFIITDSDNSKKDIIKFLKVNPEKIQVIPLAADQRFAPVTDSFKLKIKDKYQLPDKFILYVGDANFPKNLPFLIRGFLHLIREGALADFKLVLVGEVFRNKIENINHPELESLHQMNRIIAENDLDKKILRPGFIDTEELVSFYNLATVYVQPSLYEGFGLPVLEAFASGTPVVSSSTSSLKEVGGDRACYFDPEDLDSFTQVLSRVLKDHSLQNKLSRAGLERAKQFSWEKVADETVEVYKKAVKK